MNAPEMGGAADAPAPSTPPEPPSEEDLREALRRILAGMQSSLAVFGEAWRNISESFAEMARVLAPLAAWMQEHPEDWRLTDEDELVYPCRCVCMMHPPGVCAGETDLATGHLLGGDDQPDRVVFGRLPQDDDRPHRVVCGPCWAAKDEDLVAVVEHGAGRPAPLMFAPRTPA
jgi:hypothetical protein